MTPLELFQLFFTDEIFEQITEETNKYYQYLRQSSGKALKPFKNVTVPEMKAFLGLIIAMAMGKLPTYDDYWKTGILQMPWFQSIMTRQRFRDILRYLHLVDNREIAEKDHPNYTKLGKLGKLDEKLSKLFRKKYHPEPSWSKHQH